MNLDQITTKCWILALIIRDDGERLLLGDGWFDFKDSLQHFQPNNIANDIVELQGTDGQLLAGQVRRSASQSFDGYIGDALTSKTEIENRRRQFIQFFRTRRHYKVIYIFPDGTAIQRRMGYLTDAPSVPEMWQKFPEYHVALNFEDVNYYEYAEDAQGDEIYAHDSLVKLISVQSGGLVWDEDGAVSHGYTWLNPQTVTGAYITVTDGATGSPLTLSQLTGNATQDGTPTPDSPVAVQTVTGEQVVKVEGKNLFDKDNANIVHYLIGNTSFASAANANTIYIPVIGGQTYTISTTDRSLIENDSSMAFTDALVDAGHLSYISRTTWSSSINSVTVTAPNNAKFLYAYVKWTSSGLANTLATIQLELGSTATTYEPYQGQEFEINLGKNLLPNNMSSQTLNDVIFTVNDDKSITMSGTATARTEPRIYYTNASDSVLKLKAGTTYYNNLPIVLYLYTTTYRIINPNGSYTPTADETVTQAYIRVENGETVDTTIYPMLTAGAPSSTYSPYFTPIELAKIGTYQDRIYKTDGKWYIEKQVGKVVLDGTQSFTSYTNKTTYDIVNYVGSSIKRLDSNIITTMSDNFRGANLAETYNGQKIYGVAQSSNGTYLQFSFPTGVISSNATAKTWFGNNPTTIYYALATATDTEITDETLLAQLNFVASLYEGVNNISIVPTGGAQGTMTLNYYADVDTTGAGYEWEAGEGGGPTIVQVIGVDNAQPIWTVTGPATNPTLTNITTVQTITWNGTVPNGQKLIIDMANQTAALAGANVYEFITGSWITLRPGANKLTYSAQGADQASQIQWNGVVG